VYQVGGNDIRHGHPVMQTAVTIKRILDSLMAPSCGVLFLGPFSVAEPFEQTELISGVHHYDAVTAIGNRVVSMYTAVLEMTRGPQYAGRLHTDTLNVSHYPHPRFIKHLVDLPDRIASGGMQRVTVDGREAYQYDILAGAFHEKDYVRLTAQLRPLIERTMESCQPRR
jgi:hypothetical protein